MTDEQQKPDVRGELKRLLDSEFGPFLAHSPFNPERFWGGAADAILAALPRLGFKRIAEHNHRTREARDACEKGWCDGDSRVNGEQFTNTTSHDHSREPKVWCETHQHTHIARIPRFTYLCKSCGWGQWYKLDAEAHEAACEGHETYEVEHVMRPLTEHAEPTDKQDALDYLDSIREDDRIGYGDYSTLHDLISTIAEPVEYEYAYAKNGGLYTDVWDSARMKVSGQKPLARRRKAGPWIEVTDE